MKKTKSNTSAHNASVKVVDSEQLEMQIEQAVANAIKSDPEQFSTKASQDLLRKEIKRQLGILHKGRPVDLSSTRQQRIQELNEKRAAGELKPGRPKYTAEQKAAAEAEKASKAADEKARIATMAKELLSKSNIEVVTES